MGKTLVMATHSKEVMGIADRVLSIRDGHLEEIKSQ
jgi:ABC-type lipoprotein export system ATPase subunit